MKRTLFGVACAAALGIASAGVQAQQSGQQTPPAQGQGAKPSTQGSQPEKQAQGAQGQKKGQSVMLTGCVYRTSDQPTVYALRRIDEAGSSGKSGSGQTGQAGSAQSQGSTAGSAGSQAKSGTTAGTSPGAGGQVATGAWYRLAPGAQQDLKQHVGRRVQINGMLIPGRDEKGADIVIHRLQPDRTTVTAIDLKPAPQLTINSIRDVAGSCEPAGSGAQKK